MILVELGLMGGLDGFHGVGVIGKLQEAVALGVAPFRQRVVLVLHNLVNLQQ